MNVLLVAPLYNGGPGGSSRLLHNIVNELTSSGHHVEVLTYGSPEPDEYAAFDADQSYPICRIPPQRLPGFPQS